jgi:uncharacterized membrane protein
MSESNEVTSTKTSSSNPPKLTVLIKRFLDLAWYVQIAGLIIWPIVILVIGLSIPDNIEERHTDVNFYLGFTVLSEAAQVSEFSQESGTELITGRGNIKLNNTKSALAWYMSEGCRILIALVYLLGLFYLRKLFINLSKNNVFSKENGQYIEKIAYIFIACNILQSILIYIIGLVVLNDVGLYSNTVELHPVFDINITGIVTGLAILVCAAVMKEAANIHEEQSLTI